jgi:hypothetical protein
MRVVLPTLFIAAFLTNGCAATKATIQLHTANKSVTTAEKKGAPEHATYEYTMAARYLEKAKEEAGYSDFKVSVELARGASEWADQAIIVMEKEGRGLDPDSLPGETHKTSEEDAVKSRVPAAEEDLSGVEDDFKDTPDEVQKEPVSPPNAPTPDAEAPPSEPENAGTEADAENAGTEDPATPEIVAPEEVPAKPEQAPVEKKEEEKEKEEPSELDLLMPNMLPGDEE